MGKHGPCYHCGVTNTPLWRNGPPEKPVLCNACGSRWRTKGTLENYAPLHARAEAEEIEDYRVFKVKTLPSKYKEVKILKRKNNYNFTEFEGIPLHHNQLFRRGFDEDTSNKSSSGSAISNTESCAQNGSADASDLTAGPSQPVVWDTLVPSRKRTCFTHPKPSPVEKLTKDLYTIWHEQQSSCFSASSEEDLLLESDKPMVSVEIGHGSVLIRHPNSIAREEESEASSLSVDNKRHAFSSQMVAYPTLTEDMCAPHTQTHVYVGVKEEGKGRDEDQPEKLQILTHHNSSLCHINLQDSKGKSVLDESEAVKPNSLATLIFSDNVSGADEIKTDKGCSFFSPKSSDFGVESCEQNLLLDVPYNSSFPQAELLPSLSSTSVFVRL